jgi:hypothetical protein
VILVDANLLLYAVNPAAEQHEAARAWLDAALEGPEKVGLPWPSLLAFLRIATHPRVFRPPAAMDDAWAIVEHWLAAPPAWIPLPTERHQEVVRALLAQTTGADLVPDAHLAALAVQHGLVLCSTDRDFARFDGLRWADPLG